MKSKSLLLLVLSSIFLMSCGDDDNSGSGGSGGNWTAGPITLFDEVPFYSQWNAADYVQSPSTTEPFLFKNTSYALLLDNETLSKIGTTLTMDVTLGAACDNYDRLAYINLAFMDKGEAFSEANADHMIEIGRFITPFMNKNVEPTAVPYHFNMNDVARILSDDDIKAAYDIYIEFEVYGYTAAGQQEVSGCAGSEIAFYGSLTFNSTYVAADDFTNPVFFEPLSYKYNLHKYINDSDDPDAIDGAGTNVVGETVRSITFTTTTAIKDASLYLITSNHGSNSGGEEYNRREHFVYFDNDLVLDYTPGESSCEPYRQYNTQGNGIYGSSPRSSAQWQSFSNWCPGAKIPLRSIDLGDVSAGTHTFELTVPDAQFVDNQGYIPVSVFITGEEQ